MLACRREKRSSACVECEGRRGAKSGLDAWLAFVTSCMLEQAFPAPVRGLVLDQVVLIHPFLLPIVDAGLRPLVRAKPTGQQHRLRR